MTTAKQLLIILDRDGVINFDSDDYIKSADEWVAIKSSLAAISDLTKAGYTLVVASNQSGISRGLLTLKTLATIHDKMLKEVADSGGAISAIEFCPDHPDRAGEDRKPSTGMVLRLLNRFNAKAKDTWFVGDSQSDISCAINANCKPALVLTGKGERTLKAKGFDKNIPVFENLKAFTDQLLAKSS